MLQLWCSSLRYAADGFAHQLPVYAALEAMDMSQAQCMTAAKQAETQ